MTKIELIQLINIQREIIRSKVTIKGWSNYVIYAAIISIIAMIIDIQESDKNIEIKNVVYWISLFINVMTLIRFIPKHLKGKQTTFINAEQKPISNFAIIVIILLYSIVLLFVNYYRILPAPYLNTYNIINCMLILIFVLVKLVSLLKTIPVPHNNSSASVGFMRYLFIAILAIYVFTTWGFVKSFRADYIASIAEMKIAGLFITIIFLFFILIRHDINLSISNQLESLIKRLTFDKIDVETAEKELKAILIGFDSKDYLRPIIKDFLILNTETKELINKLKILSSEFTKSDNKEKQVFLHEFEKNISRITENLHKLDKTKTQYFKHIKYLRIMQDDLASKIKPVDDLFNSVYTDIKDFEELKELIDGLRDK